MDDSDLSSAQYKNISQVIKYYLQVSCKIDFFQPEAEYGRQQKPYRNSNWSTDKTGSPHGGFPECRQYVAGNYGLE